MFPFSSLLLYFLPTGYHFRPPCARSRTTPQPAANACHAAGTCACIPYLNSIYSLLQLELCSMMLKRVALHQPSNLLKVHPPGAPPSACDERCRARCLHPSACCSSSARVPSTPPHPQHPCSVLRALRQLLHSPAFPRLQLLIILATQTLNWACNLLPLHIQLGCSRSRCNSSCSLRQSGPTPILP
jgi:hypothetical protein